MIERHNFPYCRKGANGNRRPVDPTTLAINAFLTDLRSQRVAIIGLFLLAMFGYWGLNSPLLCMGLGWAANKATSY